MMGSSQLYFVVFIFRKEIGFMPALRMITSFTLVGQETLYAAYRL